LLLRNAAWVPASGRSGARLAARQDRLAGELDVLETDAVLVRPNVQSVVLVDAVHVVVADVDGDAARATDG